MYNIFLIIFVFNILIGYTNCILQGIDVKGRILCNKRSLSNVTVELMEEDGKTDVNGHFSLYGRDEEFTVIEPYIKISYTCPILNESKSVKTMLLYPPDTLLKSYNHYSEYYYNFGEIDLYKLLN